MEKLVDAAFWRDRRVFLTGHTGFKGGWLALWLQYQGAKVTGLALPPSTTNNFFSVAGVADEMTSQLGDVRDLETVAAAVRIADPEIVFHLAAQPLVAEGYRDPITTFSTNVMGTANVFEALRKVRAVKAIVVITSDKCYENKEWAWGYRENEPLGGHDPYSASKACTEMVSASYRSSYFSDLGVGVGTARAGNVFGGGDWSENRLVPDLLAAFAAGQSAEIRNPLAVRPWQHVLDPLAGYLKLAERMVSDKSLAQAWNFGPDDSACLTVGDLATRLASSWGAHASWRVGENCVPHEAHQLRLDVSMARQRLRWTPRLSMDSAIAQTIDWHKAWIAKDINMKDFSLRQIAAYEHHE